MPLMSSKRDIAGPFAVPDQPIQSPCIGVCTLGPNDLCIGCLRSTPEITHWLSYSPERRHTIMAELPARLETLFRL